MTTHISLDLETWGTRPGCDIRSIGAVVFDPVAGRVADDTFYVATDNPIGWHQEGLKYPLHRDPETVKWWSEQSPEAQAAFDNPVDLREALDRFTDWLIDQVRDDRHSIARADFDDGLLDMSSLRIWANDPHFDVSILAEAYHAVGLPVPWHYRAPRSMKTATDLAGLTRDEYVTHGTAHNALDDAIAQAWTICKCYEKLGLVERMRFLNTEDGEFNGNLGMYGEAGPHEG